MNSSKNKGFIYVLDLAEQNSWQKRSNFSSMHQFLYVIDGQLYSSIKDGGWKEQRIECFKTKYDTIYNFHSEMCNELV